MYRSIYRARCKLLAAIIFNAIALQAVAQPDVAFYYGEAPPLNELRIFDWLVVEPASAIDPHEFGGGDNQLFAYVSVGEIAADRSYYKYLPKEWLIGQNPSWGTQIIDQSRPGWPPFFVDRIIAPLWQRGFRGFFLDTLDAYKLAVRQPERWRYQQAGLVAVIEAIKSRYPEARLILNRGYEILPQVHDRVAAVAAESIFRGWDQENKRYVTVGDAEGGWHLKELQRIKEEYQLPVIVIDYVPPGEREQARRVARRISDHGFIPWVTNAELDMLGVGNIEVMPRKILMLYDGARDPDLTFANIHAFATLPINYLGYVPEYIDVRKPLPSYPLTGRYAGIISWLGGEGSYGVKLQSWLVRQMTLGIRVALLGDFGFPMQPNLLAPFGLRVRQVPVPHTVSISEKKGVIGFELPPYPERLGYVDLRLSRGTPILQIENGRGGRMDAAAYTPWGGYVLDPYVIKNIRTPTGVRQRWIIDPIEFFATALALPAMPVPDPTTENGRRLMFVHVDGDGFISRAELPGTPFAGKALLEEVLKRYRIPTTVSIIQGEITQHENVELIEQLEGYAKEIFALPWVEIASHSFSHPFNWRAIARSRRGEGGYSLSMPGYQFDPKTEIVGSVDYINTRLAPSGKRCRVFLWTGDTNPEASVLGIASEAGLFNMNGGETTVTNSDHTLTKVASLGLQKGPYFQVYAPGSNENLYTNFWTGPFYGYERAIETFRLTDRPYRFKPIDVYYHFYSATKRSSLAALHKVYQWALKQPVMNVFASEYIEKVLDFNRVVIAREGHKWKVLGAQALRQLRIPAALGYPDFAHSRGVAGFSDHESSRYVHLTGDRKVTVALGEGMPRGPYLMEANGRLASWRRLADGVQFGLRGHLPLELRLAGAAGCRVTADGKRPAPVDVTTGGVRSYKFDEHAVETIRVSCEG